MKRSADDLRRVELAIPLLAELTPFRIDRTLQMRLRQDRGCLAVDARGRPAPTLTQLRSEIDRRGLLFSALT